MKYRFETRKLSALRPHPKQNDFFAPPSEEDVISAANEIVDHGLAPIEITPDGTIICGHTRVQACRHLGWKEVRCRVRYDLTDDDAVERRLIGDNAKRRQLGKLGMARALFGMKKLEPGRRRAAGTTRDMLAKKFNVSGRTADRWMKVLQTPLSVQEAWDQEKVSDAHIKRFLKSSPAIQRRIGKSIESGESPKTAIEKYATELVAADKRLLPALKSIPRNIQRVHDLLGPDWNAWSLWSCRVYLPQLQNSESQLQKIVAKLKADVQKAGDKS